MIETERLLLRNYSLEDFDSLYEIMSDPETMQHYPAPFDEERTRGWITWNLDNYEKYGFGLWAVVLKETGEFIGDCGITIQNIDGDLLPEIGYHINKKYWRRGFAKEAARAVRDWFFENTEYNMIYSYMKYTNVGSYSTAIANGMKKVKEYPDPKNTISYAYAISREEWKALKGKVSVFESEYCRVEYLEKYNIVFLEWKKFCSGKNYREPVMFALNLLRGHKNSNFIFDARNGFEDDKEDVKWGFEFFIPEMAKTDCKRVSFIMNKVSGIEDEMNMWEKEFRKYFEVNKFDDKKKAVAIGYVKNEVADKEDVL